LAAARPAPLYRIRTNAPLLNYSVYQRAILLFMAVVFLDEQIHFEALNRETMWLGEAKPHKVVVLGLDNFLILVGAQHVRRVTRRKHPAAHARTAQGSHPMGMPRNSADTNRKADALRLCDPFLKDFVGFVRADLFRFHFHRRNF
jgi:hypothetical protein